MTNFMQRTGSKLIGHQSRMEVALDNLRSGRPYTAEMNVDSSVALADSIYVLGQVQRTPENFGAISIATRVQRLSEQVRSYRKD